MDTLADIRPLLAQAVPWTLLLFRVAGVFIAAPMLASSMIPTRYRALMSAVIAAGLFPLVGPDLTVPADMDLFGLLPLVAGEALIGFSIGAIGMLPLLGMEFAGSIAGHQMGFGLARVYSPETDSDSEILGQILFYVGFGVYLALGGVEIMFTTLANSFKGIPLGEMGAGRAPLDLYLDVFSAGFDMAIRVAAPITGIVLLVAIALGVMSKTVPQINIMTVGFTFKIVGGIVMLILSLYAAASAASDVMAPMFNELAAWAAGAR